MLSCILLMWCMPRHMPVSPVKTKYLPVEVRGAYVELLSIMAINYLQLDWERDEINAIKKICWKESNYYALDQNPKSTAYGLYGFLDSTWKSTGIKKTDNAFMQTVAALKYIKARYRTPQRALMFHHLHNYY